MNEPHFKLKDPKSDQETSIRLHVNDSAFDHRRFVYGIKESILPDLWDLKTERPTTNKKLIKQYEKHLPTIVDDLKNMHRRIEDISLAVTNYFTRARLDKKAITAKDLKADLDSQFKHKAIISKSKEGLNQYLDRYIKELEQGSRLVKEGMVMKEGSIKNFKTFQSQFDSYQDIRHRKLDFADINLDFYRDFVNFLNAKLYRINTIGKHIARLKVIMRAAQEEGLHQNQEFTRKDFRAHQIGTDEVYLSVDEVEALRNLDLSYDQEYEAARDLFLIGIYTAQRVSDYNTITENHIHRLQSGLRVLKLTQKKTGEKVIIPINKELAAILKKYNYQPPRIQEQKLNNALKELCKQAGIKQKVEIVETIGGKKERKQVPKFQLVSSHTARRTGATNMYLAKIPPIDIMKITGHTRESTFLKYIRVSKEETADKLSTHHYFK